MTEQETQELDGSAHVPEELDIEGLLDAHSNSLHAIVKAVISAVKENGFETCHMQFGDIGIDTSRNAPSDLTFVLGTFKVELNDRQTSMAQKVDMVKEMLAYMKELDFRPDRMLMPKGHDPENEAPEEMYG